MGRNNQARDGMADAASRAAGTDRGKEFTDNQRGRASYGSQFLSPERAALRLDTDLVDAVMERRRARLAELGFPT